MVRRGVMLVCLWILVAGCQTTTSVKVASKPAPLIDVKGTLSLSDGTSVPGARLAVQCGALARSVVTNARGEFEIRGVAEGNCQISGYGLNEDIRVGANVLRRVDDVRLTLPDVYTMTLRWGSKQSRVTAVLDHSTQNHPLDIDGTPQGPLLYSRLASRLASGAKLPKHPVIKILSFDARPWMPVALRGEPRGDEVSKLRLLDLRHRLTHLTPGSRRLLWLGSCDKVSSGLRQELEHLAAAYRPAGLDVALLLTSPCSAKEKPRFPAGVSVLLGGEEAQWALKASPGQALFLDRDNRVIYRHMVSKSGHLDDAVSFMQQRWPLFGASQRVSLNEANSVKVAETGRLLAQAIARIKAKKYPAAHRYVDRLLALSPDDPEGHKQRALIKAHLGDLSGALREVSWWRASFGNESADDLMDTIKQVSAR